METQIFQHANIESSKQSSKNKPKILQDLIITLQLISSFNTSQNPIFPKSSFENRPIIT
jgi:hypothetical protein